jgi:hypothetical protein
VVCGQFKIYLYAQPVSCNVPGESLVMDTARPRNPLHFPNVCTASVPFCTSGPHVSAQKPVSRRSPSQARDRAATEVSGGLDRLSCASLRGGRQLSLAFVPSLGHDRASGAARGPAGITGSHRSWSECLPGKSDKAPPCMRWRGLARPRRVSRPVARFGRHCAPPAGARYPCGGPVARLLSRSRGRPQGGARFQR